MLISLTRHQIGDLVAALEKQIDLMVQVGTEAGFKKAQQLGHLRNVLLDKRPPSRGDDRKGLRTKTL